MAKENVMQSSERIAKKKKQGLLHEYWKHKELFLLLLPAVIYFIVFHYAPMYGILWASKISVKCFRGFIFGRYFATPWSSAF